MIGLGSQSSVDRSQKPVEVKYAEIVQGTLKQQVVVDREDFSTRQISAAKKDAPKEFFVESKVLIACPTERLAFVEQPLFQKLFEAPGVRCRHIDPFKRSRIVQEFFWRQPFWFDLSTLGSKMETLLETRAV